MFSKPACMYSSQVLPPHVALVKVLVDAAILLELLGDLADRLHIGHGFEARSYRLLLVVDERPLAVVVVGANILDLELGVRRQDDVREIAVVFEPGVLNDDELDRLVAQCILHGISAVPARLPTRRIRPDHVQALVAFQREGERAVELIGSRHAGRQVPVPLNRRIHDCLGNHGLGNEAVREAAIPAAIRR